MSRRFLLSFLLGYMILTIPAGLPAQSKASRTEDLVKESEVIVHGKVTALASSWNESKTRIETRVGVAVDETMKGSLPEKMITVVVPGGEIDGVGEWYSHFPRFAQDEDVVLFAKKDKQGHYGIAGGDGGKFSVAKDPKTGVRMIPNVGTLETFSSKIRKTVLAQQAETNKK